MSPKVLAIVTNYKRPENVPTILNAIRKQTHKPDSVIVVDNSPYSDIEGYPNPKFRDADDVWRFKQNLGCSCHFAPAFMLPAYDYVWFLDDDVLPGSNALRFILQVATELDNNFATIGQVGRLFRMDRTNKYDPSHTPLRGDKPVICNLSCRTHLVRRDMMLSIMLFRDVMVRQLGELGVERTRVHDDMLMCLGIQMNTGLPSYLMPKTKDPENSMIKITLDEGKVAVSGRPQHYAERHEWVELALRVGWKPVMEPFKVTA